MEKTFSERLKDNRDYALKVEPFVGSGMSRTEMFGKAHAIIEQKCIEESLKGSSWANFCCQNLIKKIYPDFDNKRLSSWRVCCVFAEDFAAYLRANELSLLVEVGGSFVKIKW